VNRTCAGDRWSFRLFRQCSSHALCTQAQCGGRVRSGLVVAQHMESYIY